MAATAPAAQQQRAAASLPLAVLQQDVQLGPVGRQQLGVHQRLQRVQDDRMDLVQPGLQDRHLRAKTDNRHRYSIHHHRRLRFVMLPDLNGMSAFCVAACFILVQNTSNVKGCWAGM